MLCDCVQGGGRFDAYGDELFIKILRGSRLLAPTWASNPMAQCCFAVSSGMKMPPLVEI